MPSASAAIRPPGEDIAGHGCSHAAPAPAVCSAASRRSRRNLLKPRLHLRPCEAGLSLCWSGEILLPVRRGTASRRGRGSPLHSRHAAFSFLSGRLACAGLRRALLVVPSRLLFPPSSKKQGGSARAFLAWLSLLVALSCRLTSWHACFTETHENMPGTAFFLAQLPVASGQPERLRGLPRRLC